MGKKKKEKTVYYDDNSTIADMSTVTQNGKKEPTQRHRPNSTFREKLTTYWNAVKMMVLPMCIALAALALIYLLIMLTSGNM